MFSEVLIHEQPSAPGEREEVLVQHKNLLTGEIKQAIIDLTAYGVRYLQFKEDFNSWQNGELIQRAMSYLDANTREFMISGILPEEWDAIFGEDEEDDEYS